MDNEQAKFILSSYLPNHGEAGDRDFAEALALAADNRELGEWLARERAMDESFTKALASLELPGKLREDILGCLDGERNDMPQAGDADDARMIGALAAVRPPASLRGNILAAMEKSQPVGRTGPVRRDSDIPVASGKVTPFWKRFSVPLAAAAGIALALLVTRSHEATGTVADNRVPLEAVPVSFIQTFESPSFSLDVKQERQELLVESLKSRSLPCPCCLPPGLEGAKSIGCRELTINGRHGSLICFQQNDLGTVHLVIFSRQDVDGSCSNLLAEPCYLENGDWSIARWQNEDSVFFLLGKGEIEQMKTLF